MNKLQALKMNMQALTKYILALGWLEYRFCPAASLSAREFADDVLEIVRDDGRTMLGNEHWASRHPVEYRDRLLAEMEHIDDGGQYHGPRKDEFELAVA